MAVLGLCVADLYFHHLHAFPDRGYRPFSLFERRAGPYPRPAAAAKG